MSQSAGTNWTIANQNAPRAVTTPHPAGGAPPKGPFRGGAPPNKDRAGLAVAPMDPKSWISNSRFHPCETCRHRRNEVVNNARRRRNVRGRRPRPSVASMANGWTFGMVWKSMPIRVEESYFIPHRMTVLSLSIVLVGSERFYRPYCPTRDWINYFIFPGMNFFPHSRQWAILDIGIKMDSISYWICRGRCCWWCALCFTFSWLGSSACRSSDFVMKTWVCLMRLILVFIHLRRLDMGISFQ